MSSVDWLDFSSLSCLVSCMALEESLFWRGRDPSIGQCFVRQTNGEIGEA